MTYLLDTAPFLWAMFSPERLSARVRRVLEDRNNPLIVSSASLWEVVVKADKGILPMADPVRWLDGAVRSLDLGVLPIRPAHVYALATLPRIHKDPFDRIIVAQAGVESCTLICNDDCMRRYPVPTLW